MHQAVEQGQWTQEEGTIAWHNGIVRIAANDKQRKSLASAADADPDRLTALTTDQLQQRMRGEEASGVDDDDAHGVNDRGADALLLRNAVVLHPQRYMRYAIMLHWDLWLIVLPSTLHVAHHVAFLVSPIRALWLACVDAATTRNIHLELVHQPITSLALLRQQEPQLTAIVVAAGAAVGVLPELGRTAVGA